VSGVARAWRLARHRLGTAGLIALALAVATAAIALWLPRLNRESDALRDTLAAAAQRAARAPATVQRPMSDREQVQQFVSRFPPLSRNAEDLERVFALAKKRRIDLLKGDYQLKSEPNSPLISYTATFPVQNEYKALKAFTGDVLQALPHVSMDELRMSRADARSGSLDSIVRFTFVYGSP
jgi:hypothetical protein